MPDIQTGVYVIGALVIAIAANAVAAIWASKASLWSPWLLAVVLISPFVFLSFGIVTSRLGVSIAAGTLDSLLAISTVLIGLIAFGEWNKLSIYQYAGLALFVLAIYLMLFTRPTS